MNFQLMVLKMIQKSYFSSFFYNPDSNGRVLVRLDFSSYRLCLIRPLKEITSKEAVIDKNILINNF